MRKYNRLLSNNSYPPEIKGEGSKFSTFFLSKECNPYEVIGPVEK